jgi:hypothetical protein
MAFDDQSHAVYIDYEYPVELFYNLSVINKCNEFWNDRTFFGDGRDDSSLSRLVPLQDAWLAFHRHEDGFTYVAPGQVQCRPDRIYSNRGVRWQLESSWMNDGWSNERPTSAPPPSPSVSHPISFRSFWLAEIHEQWQPSDTMATLTIIALLLLVFLVHFARRRSNRRQQNREHQTALWLLLLLVCTLTWFVPSLMKTFSSAATNWKEQQQQQPSMEHDLTAQQSSHTIPFLISDHIPLFASFQYQMK